MADNKEINLPQSASYSNLPEYKDHVAQILNSYDSPEGVLGELVRQMADGLDHLHKLGVAHRDMKPANIMIGQYGEIMVMDWGLAMVLKSGVNRLSSHISSILR